MMHYVSCNNYLSMKKLCFHWTKLNPTIWFFLLNKITLVSNFSFPTTCSTNEPPALHQRTSVSNSSSHNEVRQPPILPEIPNASEKQLSELHHSKPTVENVTPPKPNSQQPNTPVIVPTISNAPEPQQTDMHLSEAPIANSNSPQTNMDDAIDTFYTCGGQTTPPHRNLSLIESVGTEEPEFNSSEGLSQSTPVQVMERQIT